MERALIFISLLTIAQSLDIRQYYHVLEKMSWTEAQEYCRRYYEDLASVKSESEQKALEKAAGFNVSFGFFGLYKDHGCWKWSGGENVTYTNWNDGEPSSARNAHGIAVMVTKTGGWNDVDTTAQMFFYCMGHPTVEKVEMNWEDAEEYCRESDRSLISLRSDTERVWLQRRMTEQGHDRIWTGLRFLAGGWLWVNGDPLGFQAWREGERDPQCPLLERCGAVTAEGHWETLDCREKLLFMCN